MSIAQTFRAWQESRERQSPPESLPEDACLRSLRSFSPDDEPFSESDTTAGAENELQVAVVGSREAVDLPRQITSSRFFENLTRCERPDRRNRRRMLERYLNDNPEEVWENSWVCFPSSTLAPETEQVFLSDLHSERGNLESPLRSDSERFLVRRGDEIMLRIPVSYLLKLAQVDVVHSLVPASPAVRDTALRCSEHFLNDNTSPETFSFNPVSASDHQSPGQALAAETARRYLLTQLLIEYANNRFRLREHGQEVVVFQSPNPPVRQRFLNTCLSDTFYRELFMSPCLSGWAHGQEKQQYMGLCHEVLSRSKINAVKRLKEAGIIVNNLVVLPHTSNVSLSNNGIHVSLGSRMLTRALAGDDPGFTAAHEKCVGDLALKLSEHFLPLSIGLYGAAPYRLDFLDFHPEELLGFLPHELAADHLQTIWQGWKKKASNRFFGRPITPFGPVWLDTLLSRSLGWRGDFVPDHRLLDYLVALGSTEHSPALDGQLGNDHRLKHDLASLGVFDTRMALYQPGRLRTADRHGFSGVEYRHYSLFPRFREDFGGAVDLQRLITAYAYRQMSAGRIRHADIPDTVAVESERRQMLFASAIGLPGFYVDKQTPNRFLRAILARTRGIRASGRYPGRVFVPLANYRRALLEELSEDTAPSAPVLQDLAHRLGAPGATATDRLVAPVLDALGARSPGRVAPRVFNLALERHYRQGLRAQHIAEAWEVVREDVHRLDRRAACLPDATRVALHALAGERSASTLLNRLEERATGADPADLVRLIHLLLIVIREAGAPATEPAYA